MWIFIVVIILLIIAFGIYLLNKNSQTKTTTESKEGFNSKETNKADKANILVFLSSGCPHCVTYKKNTHSLIETYAKNKGHDLKVVPEDDSDTFSKYNIMYIPACVIIKGNKQEQLKGEISEENIEKTITNM